MSIDVIEIREEQQFLGPLFAVLGWGCDPIADQEIDEGSTSTPRKALETHLYRRLHRILILSLTHSQQDFQTTQKFHSNTAIEPCTHHHQLQLLERTRHHAPANTRGGPSHGRLSSHASRPAPPPEPLTLAPPPLACSFPAGQRSQPRPQPSKGAAFQRPHLRNGRSARGSIGTRRGQGRARARPPAGRRKPAARWLRPQAEKKR
eukprot:514293-Rhodomonas_salina.3